MSSRPNVNLIAHGVGVKVINKEYVLGQCERLFKCMSAK